ncbi:unnamed protein product [Medioppia subpectinata]|nr:unnamed protein product [Medioppia subpectinata]CAG2113848.1 unnamed protein product [Medioppia subpectinata]
MTAVDTLLPLGVLLSCMEAYAPEVAVNTAAADSPVSAKEPEESDDELKADDVVIGAAVAAVVAQVMDSPTADGGDFELISHDELPADEDLPTAPTPKWGHQWINASMAKLSAHSPFAGRRQMPRPWYRRPEPALGVKLESLNAVVNNPYISPLLSAPDFHDIPLYLVALVYDACLDDSVQMAKKWKGPVCLDVIDALPHGFLNFVLLSEEAQRAGDLCLDRVQQALT